MLSNGSIACYTCISIEKKEFERLREKKLDLYQKISEDNDRIDAQTKKVPSAKMSNIMQILRQITQSHKLSIVNVFQHSDSLCMMHQLLEIQTANKLAAADLARAEAKYKADSERVSDFCEVLENNMNGAAFSCPV